MRGAGITEWPLIRGRSLLRSRDANGTSVDSPKAIHAERWTKSRELEGGRGGASRGPLHDTAPDPLQSGHGPGVVDAGPGQHIGVKPQAPPLPVAGPHADHRGVVPVLGVPHPIAVAEAVGLAGIVRHVEPLQQRDLGPARVRERGAGVPHLRRRGRGCTGRVRCGAPAALAAKGQRGGRRHRTTIGCGFGGGGGGGRDNGWGVAIFFFWGRGGLTTDDGCGVPTWEGGGGVGMTPGGMDRGCSTRRPTAVGPYRRFGASWGGQGFPSQRGGGG